MVVDVATLLFCAAAVVVDVLAEAAGVAGAGDAVLPVDVTAAAEGVPALATTLSAPPAAVVVEPIVESAPAMVGASIFFSYPLSSPP